MPLILPFTSPVNGPNGVDANRVRGNDNVLGAAISNIASGAQVLTTPHMTSPVVDSGAVSLMSAGAAAVAGTATLVGGTVTVNTTAMTATALLFVNRKTNGGTIGTTTYTQVNGTSFTINSSNALDTSVFVWLIVETHT